MRFSIQPGNRIFAKSCGFLSFAKNMCKKLSKSLSGKYSQKLLDYAKQSATDALNYFKINNSKEKKNQLLILLVIKLLIELQNSQKLRRRIIQKQLQTNMIKNT